ncbi:MAG: 16S rRNA (guanine(966)-N(2))-methyltransferase RsmD [Candidatus Omnitrophota bacterium]|nr:16S rRNA (guanine(966)-N(2))-methyltransferase RsmD [Candidatus Omnitrophota bacterium]MDZ4241834.1 16S rRNA (guanine(966)-N(2))-methyltransferase RsmD [Candidatus Omnitrophota bacterium]
MKIIGGKFKGKNFFMPAGIRPTQNIIRKAVFDLLGNDMEGVEFLELFAGSGAVGFEAFSRGAKKVAIVERDFKCIKVIQQNMAMFDPPARPGGQGAVCELIQCDAFVAIKQMASQKRKFDVIFLDPPYGEELVKKALNLLAGYDILHPDCYIIIEFRKDEILPGLKGRFSVIRERCYGSTCLAVLQRESPQA